MLPPLQPTANRLRRLTLICLCCAAGACTPLCAQDSDASALLEDAARLLEQSRLEQAVPILSRALQLAGPVGSDEWLRAAYGMATVLHQQTPFRPENLRRALQLYQKIHGAAPQSSFGQQALLMIARLRELPDYPGDEIRLDEARAIYRQLAESNRSHPLGLEAAIRYASTFLQESATDRQAPVGELGTSAELARKGTSYLESYLQQAPASPFRNAAYEYLGYAYWRGQREKQKAMEAWLRATGDYGLLSGAEPVEPKQNVDRINPGYLYWAIANLAQDLGERAVSVEYYGQIVTEVPRYKGTMARVRLREMGVPEEEIPSTVGFEARR